MNARSEFISRLKDMPEEYSKVAIRAFDFIEHNYEITKKETALSTVVEQMQREVALYRDCKTVEGCSKAAAETRELVRQMCDLVIEKCPEFEPELIPMCARNGGICYEIRPCTDD